jgi:hypothetical protein
MYVIEYITCKLGYFNWSLKYKLLIVCKFSPCK